MHEVRQLSPWIPSWEDIRDEEVRKAELEGKVQLVRLQGDHYALTERQKQVDAELERMGESEANVKAHRTMGGWWLGLFGLATIVVVLSAWWSLNWFLSLSWEKALLSGALFVLPLIGWAAFLLRGPSMDLRRVIWSMGLVIILASVVATTLLAAGRMLGTTIVEQEQQASVNRTDELTAPRETSESRFNGLKKVLAAVNLIAIICLGLAAEAAAGIAFHEYWKHRTVVWTVEPYYKERGAVLQAIVENIGAQERVKQYPQMLHAQITADGLRQQQALAEQTAAEQQRRQEWERSASRRLAVRIVVGLLAGLLVLFGAVWLALAQEPPAEVTVVVLDLSASVADEFTKNVQAIDGVIERLPPATRFVVLGIREASFGSPPLFSETSPRVPGRFGEYLGTWRTKAIQRWRTVAKDLRPSAKGSDVFGALARAVSEFDELPKAKRTLVILSDMRHVGRGVNLERPHGDAKQLVTELARQKLVPRLDGVTVWALGAHTAAFEERQWQAVRGFWTEYFREAGATLAAFSPNRRLAEGRP